MGQVTVNFDAINLSYELKNNILSIHIKNISKYEHHNKTFAMFYDEVSHMLKIYIINDLNDCITCSGFLLDFDDDDFPQILKVSSEIPINLIDPFKNCKFDKIDFSECISIEEISSRFVNYVSKIKKIILPYNFFKSGEKRHKIFKSKNIEIFNRPIFHLRLIK